MGTHGNNDINNCHPFRMSDNSFLMHNGILSSFTKGLKKGESDTGNFVRTFCNPQIESLGKLNLKIFEAATKGQAMAIMHKRGRITRHGNSWFEHDGLWFSNSYAWDAPTTWKPENYFDHNGYDNSGMYNNREFVTPIANYADAELSGSQVIGSNLYGTCDAMIDDWLYSSLWELPLDEEKYIDVRDDFLYDNLVNGKIETEDFLQQISPETKINLFIWMINSGRV